MDLKTFLKNTFHKDLHEVDLCVKGWNWGDVIFRGSLLSFNMDSKPAFEVPLKEVSQVSFNLLTSCCIGYGYCLMYILYR